MSNIGQPTGLHKSSDVDTYVSTWYASDIMSVYKEEQRDVSAVAVALLHFSNLNFNQSLTTTILALTARTPTRRKHAGWNDHQSVLTGDGGTPGHIHPEPQRRLLRRRAGIPELCSWSRCVRCGTIAIPVWRANEDIHGQRPCWMYWCCTIHLVINYFTLTLTSIVPFCALH